MHVGIHTWSISHNRDETLRVIAKANIEPLGTQLLLAQFMELCSWELSYVVWHLQPRAKFVSQRVH